MIGTFVERFGSEDSSLADLRITCLIVMAFAGFLRISEVLHLRRNQINILNTHCEMFIDKAKTDVMRDGNIVPVARTDNSTCPVKRLERYLFKSKKKCSLIWIYFQACRFCKSRKEFILKSNSKKPISYSSVRDIFKAKLSNLGLHAAKYGLHSFRSGAASTSANHHVSERLIQRHGRWRGSTSKDGYVKDSLKDRLSVSRNLNLW